MPILNNLFPSFHFLLIDFSEVLSEILNFIVGILFGFISFYFDNVHLLTDPLSLLSL